MLKRCLNISKQKAREIPQIKNIKGRGLMLGLEFDFAIGDLRKTLIHKHHIFTGSSKNPNLLRILPPLTVQEEHFDVFFEALKSGIIIMKWNTGLYNEKHSFVYEYGESLIALLEAQPDDRILDLGCGTGELTKSIGLLTKNVVGMDASPDMVSTAKKSFPEIEFQEKDATHFDFEIPFDAIFSNATLHWVLDYEFCIKSMYRNLKEGGKVVLEFGGKRQCSGHCKMS